MNQWWRCECLDLRDRNIDRTIIDELALGHVTPARKGDVATGGSLQLVAESESRTKHAASAEGFGHALLDGIRRAMADHKHDARCSSMIEHHPVNILSLS